MTGTESHTIEEWRPIPGSDGLYGVSSLGRVRSEPLAGRPGRQRGRVLTPSSGRKGYLLFRICLPGRRPVTTRVHRAVALAFLGPAEEGQQVNHRNGIKTDNRPENLEYVDCRENVRHCWRLGLHGTEHCRGEAGHHAKLDEDAVRAIRRRRPETSLGQLASEYGVTKQAIWQIVRRRTWNHVL